MKESRAVAVTPMQRKLLTAQRLYPADASFNLAAAFHLSGVVEGLRFRACARKILSECVALNTIFENDGGDARATIVRTSYEPELRLVRGHANAEEEGAAVARSLGERADLPIPPDRHPLYEMVVHVGEHGAYLTFLCSHLVADAYTFYNLIALAEGLYQDRVSWDELRPVLAQDPATLARKPSGGAGVPDFRRLLQDVTALAHEALAAPRGPGGALQGENVRVVVPSDLGAALRASPLVARHRPFTVFLAAYAVLLSVLTAREWVVVGVPVANRRGRAQRAAFGYFVNTLPLRVDLSAHETFDELCAAIAADVFVLLRHQDFDLTEHADEVLDGTVSRPVAVDNAFTYYKAALAPRLCGEPLEAIEVPRRLVKYPLGMHVEDCGDRYVLGVESVPHLAFADPAACALEILRAVAADEAVALRDVRLLSPARAAAADVLLNAGGDYAVPPSLDDWFGEVAAEHAAEVAITDEEGAWTYAQLDDAAGRVAAALRADWSGDSVAVAMHRRRDLVAVILGVLRSGKTYVPLDPEAPRQRARQIADQFNDLALVADSNVLPELAALPRLAPSVLLEHAPLPPRERAGDLRDQPAYVIFTSGSTGVPKGVEVTHRNVMRLLRAAEEHFDFGPGDAWTLFHSYAFDFSVWEIFGALLTGGRLVVVPDRTARSPEAFAELLRRERVTVLNQTPSAFRQLTKVLRSTDRNDLAVRWVVFGGEALHVEIIAPWLRTAGERARLVNMYGITETTVHVTFHEVTPDRVGAERESVIGRPLGDLSVHVVDRYLNPCPPGIRGELLVGGAGVARGYLNRPDLTAERFLRGTRYGDVIYRTGDAGYLRHDGTLVHLGRIDLQVQLRGYRIELGEVEAALLAAGVRECAVRLDESAGEPRLVGYLVAEDDLEDGALRAELLRQIPPYMVPTLFLRLDALPLTVNGKVDDRRLPAPPAGPAAVVDDADDALVRAIVAIWADVVRSGSIDVHGSFFEAGGTSMHVAEVHRRLVDELGARDLTMVELFEFPTPAALAERLGRRGAEVSPPRARRSRTAPVRRRRTTPATREEDLQ